MVAVNVVRAARLVEEVGVAKEVVAALLTQVVAVVARL
jgi:hypothetical protein